MTFIQSAMVTKAVRTRLKEPERPVGRAGSADRIVETIHRGILAGRYVPGQKLIEAELTASLGVSRGPIREGLKRLEAEGVVEITLHRGAQIRAVSRTEAQDLLQILEVLTILIARLAADAIGEGTAAKLVAEAKTWTRPASGNSLDNSMFLEQRIHFYDILIAMGGNSQLRSLMPMMRIHLLRLQIQSYFKPPNTHNWLTEYAAIMRAVLDGNPSAAQRAMKQHMKRMQERIRRLPSDAFVRDD
jgi:DNA-binding GntR family transcriptional regulator